MSPRFILDEQLRGQLWNAVQWHNRCGAYPLDVIRVGDPADLPLGSDDAEVLRWAEIEGRIVLSSDRATLLTHFDRHREAGRHSAGVFVLRPQATLPQILEFLVAASYASDSAEWIDAWRYIP